MTNKPYSIDKIYLKTIKCKTHFYFKDNGIFIKLIPIITEKGLIWIPKSKDINSDYHLLIKNKLLAIQFSVKKKNKYIYLVNENEYIKYTKNYKKTNYTSKNFKINNLILDKRHKQLKLITTQ